MLRWMRVRAEHGGNDDRQGTEGRVVGQGTDRRTGGEVDRKDRRGG